MDEGTTTNVRKVTSSLTVYGLTDPLGWESIIKTLTVDSSTIPGMVLKWPQPTKGRADQVTFKWKLNFAEFYSNGWEFILAER